MAEAVINIPDEKIQGMIKKEVGLALARFFMDQARSSDEELAESPTNEGALPDLETAGEMLRYGERLLNEWGPSIEGSQYRAGATTMMNSLVAWMVGERL